MMFVKQDNSNANVIKLLETACLDLAVMSSKREGRPPEHLIYKRMVWGTLLAPLYTNVIAFILIVSIAIKCHSVQTGVGTRNVDEVWNKYLVQV